MWNLYLLINISFSFHQVSVKDQIYWQLTSVVGKNQVIKGVELASDSQLITKRWWNSAYNTKN